MSNRVEALLEFHATRNFGNRDNLLARQRAARSTYASMTEDEADELANTVLAKAEGPDEERVHGPLCCLACFRPGSLRSVHQRLVENRILYSGVIYHGAGLETSRSLLNLLWDDEHRNHALTALAWIGDEIVQQAFAEWRATPPKWASQLFVPPESYAHEAGWELTKVGLRRELYSEIANPLVRPTAVDSLDERVQVGVPSAEQCPWCGRGLIALISWVQDAELLPNEPKAQVQVLTCDACTAFGTIFSRSDSSGRASWHEANERPEYLPPDISSWDPFPHAPLVLSGDTRHFLEAANWSLLPGVSFSQIGGLPTWVQDAEYPACPDCSQTMPFIGQISNEDFMQLGEGIYYAFRCPGCNVTATNYQQS